MSTYREDISSRVRQAQYEEEKAKQGFILDILIQENSVGRWVWKSGDLKQNFTIPWEIQATNTNPDNFLWEQGKTSVLVVLPGLYEVHMAFFSKKKPIVQLLVNGEVVLNVVSQPNYLTTSGHKTSLSKHNFNVTGLSVNDFLALPSKCRVSLSFQGEDTAEGFFELRKL